MFPKSKTKQPNKEELILQIKEVLNEKFTASELEKLKNSLTGAMSKIVIATIKQKLC